ESAQRKNDGWEGWSSATAWPRSRHCERPGRRWWRRAVGRAGSGAGVVVPDPRSASQARWAGRRRSRRGDAVRSQLVPYIGRALREYRARRIDTGLFHSFSRMMRELDAEEIHAL